MNNRWDSEDIYVSRWFFHSTSVLSLWRRVRYKTNKKSTGNRILGKIQNNWIPCLFSLHIRILFVKIIFTIYFTDWSRCCVCCGSRYYSLTTISTNFPADSVRRGPSERRGQSARHNHIFFTPSTNWETDKIFLQLPQLSLLNKHLKVFIFAR